ncbi:Kae1-associated serine/threonine protein kinase, partial [Methanoculleus chikugoensis]|uniref:KEOPS complex kinase/ATPase Bud32 n=1 Tax=Methanoculleus chikugoensis TaxID=118126 RepID=UPI000A731E33
IVMERVKGEVLKYVTAPETIRLAGEAVGRLHGTGIVHGDLTTSNMIVRDGQCVLIDFGLASTSSEVESRGGVDLHVFFQTLESTTENFEELKAAFVEGYAGAFPEADEVLAREHEVELRGGGTSEGRGGDEQPEQGAGGGGLLCGGVLTVEHVALECPEFRHADVGGEIARGKAEFAYKTLSRPLIVDDTGLFVDALGGFPPGPYAAYVHDTIGNAGILKLLEGVEDRNARFETAIAFAREDGIRVFRGGVLHGTIVAPRGGRKGSATTRSSSTTGGRSPRSRLREEQDLSPGTRARGVPRLGGAGGRRRQNC